MQCLLVIKPFCFAEFELYLAGEQVRYSLLEQPCTSSNAAGESLNGTFVDTTTSWMYRAAERAVNPCLDNLEFNRVRVFDHGTSVQKLLPLIS